MLELVSKNRTPRLPKSLELVILFDTMKNRTGVLVLAVLCLGLGIGLIVIWTHSTKQQQADAASIVTLSNNLATVSETLQAHDLVITNLYKERDENRGTIQDLHSRVTTVSNALSKTTSELTERTSQLTQKSDELSRKGDELTRTQKSLETQVAEVAKRDTEIAKLQRQNQDLDKQAFDLGTSITNLNLQITETQRKLADSNADKAALDKELKRLMAEKAELERQFNDVNVVRAQYAKLKEEMYAARRVEWARTGVYSSAEEKGASGLMSRPTVVQAQPPKKAQPSAGKSTSQYNLNVEIKSDGSVKVISPVTNAPARP